MDSVARRYTCLFSASSLSLRRTKRLELTFLGLTRYFFTVAKRNPSSKEILEAVERNRKALKKFGIRRLGLFGSGATGKLKKDSDLDFVVDFEIKTFDAYMDLKAFLEKLFSRKVDLVTRESIKPRLKTRILSSVIYATGL